MTEPYFSEDGITIYHGDCQDILFGPLTGAYFDLLLTDPPYGEADVWKGGGWGPHTAPEKQVERGKWDITPDRDWLTLMLTRAADSIIWGGNHFQLPVSRGWLVWYKPGPQTLSDAELAWTSRDTVIWAKKLPRNEPGRLHPTQKPQALMEWCLSLFPDANTVVDPYMGSGTTLVAAKVMGLTAVGIEQDEKWCEHAAKRLSQGVFDLFGAEA